MGSGFMQIHIGSAGWECEPLFALPVNSSGTGIALVVSLSEGKSSIESESWSG